MRMKSIKTILGSMSLFLLGLAVILVSCNNESNGPVAPQTNDGAANFYAISGSSCEKPYGAYYKESEGEFSLKICEPGDYQIEYEVDDGNTYYLWVRVKQSAILRIGLSYPQASEPKMVKVIQVRVRKGTIDLADNKMNSSGPVRYYPSGGVAVPMDPSLFASDGSDAVSPIVNSEVNEGDLVDQLPEPVRFSPDPTPAPTSAPGGDGGGLGGGFNPASDLGITVTGGLTLTLTGANVTTNNAAAVIATNATGTYTIQVNNATGASQNATITVSGVATQNLSCTGPASSIVTAGANLGGNVDAGAGTSGLTCPTNTTCTVNTPHSGNLSCTGTGPSYTIQGSAAIVAGNTVQDGATISFVGNLATPGTCTAWYWGKAPTYYPETYVGGSEGYALGADSAVGTRAAGGAAVSSTLTVSCPQADQEFYVADH